ncbi:hypothetical protein ABW19_dt0208664 [Dactylella cylindrospora]|nr:hypothetical protein ABW19_dt0208664 [Dactylella cylindrospora]
MASHLEYRISGLQSELEVARKELRNLELEQTLFLQSVRSDSRLALTHSVRELLKLVTFVYKADKNLIRYNSNPKFVKYLLEKVSERNTIENRVERQSDKIEKSSSYVETVFVDTESRLNDNMRKVMKEEERATEMATVRIGVLTGKVSSAKSDVESEIRQTERSIRESEQEQRNATSRVSELESQARETKQQAENMRRRRSQASGRAGGGAAISIFGAILTPFVPFVGIPMAIAGSGMAIGNGIDASNYGDRVKALERDRSNTMRTINNLENKISRLRSTILPQLKEDQDRFTALDSKVTTLKSSALSLQDEAQTHVRQLTDAKNSIADATYRISELNAHILQLGFADTREEMAEALDAIMSRLTEGSRRIGDGHSDTKEIGRVNEKIGRIRANSERVLAIIDA